MVENKTFKKKSFTKKLFLNMNTFFENLTIFENNIICVKATKVLQHGMC
jgi:hypothetical protein